MAYQSASLIYGDDTVRFIIGAVVEQERFVGNGNGRSQIRQCSQEAGVQLLVRYVVATVLGSMLDQGHRQHGAVQANEHYEDSKAAAPRVLKESQFRANRVRKHRLGTERETGFYQRRSQSLGFGERAPVNQTRRPARRHEERERTDLR